MTFWYVSYSFTNNIGSGEGGCTLSVNSPKFMVGSARNAIKDSIGASTLVVRSWRRITQDQYDEFNAVSEREGSTNG